MKLEEHEEDLAAITAAIAQLDPNRRVGEKVKLMINHIHGVSSNDVWQGCWKLINGRMRCSYQWQYARERWNLVVSYDAATRDDVRFDVTMGRKPNV